MHRVTTDRDMRQLYEIDGGRASSIDAPANIERQWVSTVEDRVVVTCALQCGSAADEARAQRDYGYARHHTRVTAFGLPTSCCARAERAARRGIASSDADAGNGLDSPKTTSRLLLSLEEREEHKKCALARFSLFLGCFWLRLSG
jgi:hypothetical protein